MLSTNEDRKIFHNLLRPERLKQSLPGPPGDLLSSVAELFLETPYAAHTLEQESRESLVINLRQLDCFTFVEAALALTKMIQAGRTSLADFAASLQESRYRNGRVNGYSSRLHYFSDWLHENEKRGFLKDVTKKAGGERYFKKLDFMTANAHEYPALRNRAEYLRMVAVEKACEKRPLYHIPKERLRACEGNIKDGDLIAITTDTEGLDVTHAGIAIRLKRGIHLIHASKKAGKVIVSPETLYGYLKKRKSRLGVMVARVL